MGLRVKLGLFMDQSSGTVKKVVTQQIQMTTYSAQLLCHSKSLIQGALKQPIKVSKCRTVPCFSQRQVPAELIDRRQPGCHGWRSVEAATIHHLVPNFWTRRKMMHGKALNFDIWRCGRLLLETHYVSKSESADFFVHILTTSACSSGQLCPGSSEATQGATPDVSSKPHFEDNQFLKAVLENDPLLYSIEDNFEDGVAAVPQFEVDELQGQLAVLPAQFSADREPIEGAILDCIENTAHPVNQAHLPECEGLLEGVFAVCPSFPQWTPLTRYHV